MARAAGFAPPTAGLPLLGRDLFPDRYSELETDLAAFLGAPGVQIECSGTAAFIVALRTLADRAPDRDEVVVPAYTCPLVAQAVAASGLKLKLADLSPDTLDMAPEALDGLCGARTLAVVPTHLGGRVSDIRPAVEAAHRVGAWVIEDAAQALGARLGAASVGQQGDIGFYSLAVGKGLSIYEGGVLTARDAPLRRALQETSRRLIPDSRTMEARRIAELIGYALLYRPGALRWSYGAPLRQALARGDWSAAAGDDFPDRIPLHRPGRWRKKVGAMALKRLPEFLAAAEVQASSRVETLAQIAGVDVVRDSAPGARGVWPILMVRLPDQAARDAVLAQGWDKGLGLSPPFLRALPDYRRYTSVVPTSAPDALPNARSWAGRLLAISNSPWLGDADFARVCEMLRRATSARG
ncbi:MAG: DegT/DnrJ/EryC1/StrS family aminotransferase [Candidatus Brevundimonas colombiensis]|uniref:DegT/DnrJ/EryC1/StrS family aminotransferase n=1 Tax=Candidatus Brevundimonas colombiensis TaxID=3121376 RepID=A0AAJ6BJB2_9CAUL|nr:DegT/DnrJ/EryC1/StrS family aminotransferase [Brevundimonas sp.]WEK39213.1 MAG: DegT/DnrJ/EryC1/StrS family aminotransferase [Brevundimonas sp.]